jgi:hypothetical protein
VNVLFIWGNSSLPAEASNQLSQSVMEVLEKILRHPLFEKVSVRIINAMNRLLDTSIPNEDVGGTLLRKMAHFAEFCVLGLNLCWFFQIMERKGIHKFTMPLLGGMLADICGYTEAAFVFAAVVALAAFIAQWYMLDPVKLATGDK